MTRRAARILLLTRLGMIAAALFVTACSSNVVRAPADVPDVLPQTELDILIDRVDAFARGGVWPEGERLILNLEDGQVGDFIPWFEQRAEDYPPTWLYAFAKRLEQTGRYTKAVRWYVTARERHLIHLNRCLDPSVKPQRLQEVDETFEDLHRVMPEQPELSYYAIRRAFAWQDSERDTVADLLEECASGNRGQDRWEQSVLRVKNPDKPNVFELVPPPIRNPYYWIKEDETFVEIRFDARDEIKENLTWLLKVPHVPQEPRRR